MIAAEFARFLGIPFTRQANITDIIEAVCGVCADVRTTAVLVDEIHNLNIATRTGAEASDTLKYFSERVPATFVLAGINVERAGLLSGPRGEQIAGRYSMVRTGPFPRLRRDPGRHRRHREDHPQGHGRHPRRHRLPGHWAGKAVTAATRPEAPLPIRPRQVETADSYVRRLAAANHLRFSYLRRYLATPQGSFGPVDPGLLAALADREPDAILRAFPELAPAPGPRTRHGPRHESQRSKAEAARHQRKEATQEKYAAIRRDDASGMSEQRSSAGTTSDAAPSSRRSPRPNRRRGRSSTATRQPRTACTLSSTR